MYHVVRDEGLLALYYGISPAILRAATYSATRLGMYEPLRTAFMEQLGAKEASFGVKVSAAVSSGALGKFDVTISCIKEKHLLYHLLFRTGDAIF